MGKTNYKHDAYTRDEINDITVYIEKGYPSTRISEITGRSPGAIDTLVWKLKNGMMKFDANVKTRANMSKTVTAETKTEKEMTPRDMIKSLYNMGYRIENNQLVCYTKQIVKLSDIINE